MIVTLTATRRRLASIARRLGTVATAGDVLTLTGPLGAGKTFFTQHFALGLGVPPSVRVTSPTFTVVNEHQGRVGLFHSDFYRLSDPDELLQIGLFERGADGVVVVEWAERFAEVIPRGALSITLEHNGPMTRRVCFDGDGRRVDRLLSAVESL